MTLNPMCEGVETAQGVPLTVTGVAQCKIMKVCYRKYAKYWIVSPNISFFLHNENNKIKKKFQYFA